MLKKRRGAAGAEALAGLTIRPIEASRPPATDVERLAVEALQREGRISLKRLLERVAHEVYLDEVRSGGWALDIGLYGPDIFAPQVALELRSGNGVLWEIEAEARG